MIEKKIDSFPTDQSKMIDHQFLIGITTILFETMFLLRQLLDISSIRHYPLRSTNSKKKVFNVSSYRMELALTVQPFLS